MTGDAEFSTALTDEESTRFDNLRRSMAHEQVALIRVEKDGRPRAALAHVQQEPDGSYLVVPLALLLDEQESAALTMPSGAEEVDVTPSNDTNS